MSSFVNLMDIVYPVGSIYMSTSPISPATRFGGTWNQIKDKFLLSAGDDYTVSSTGGESEHTLTIDEMPHHTHNLGETLYLYTDHITSRYVNGGAETWLDSSLFKAQGGDQPHNNMPPYYVVYSWERTA